MTRAVVVVVAAVAVLVAAVGCGDDSADASAVLACRSFHSLARDITDGLSDDAATRDRIASIHSTARASEEPGIAVHAAAMHTAAVAGDRAGLADAVTAFGGACADAGEGA